MIAGLSNNTTIYPNPPVSVSDLGVMLGTFLTSEQAAIAARAAAEIATQNKDANLDILTAAMRKDLNYAENTVDGDDTQLNLIGWAGRHAPTALAAPGQTLNLKATEQGEGTVTLTWKAPLDGGKPASYCIERRERPAGAWETVSVAVVTEATLQSQTRGKEYEYRVCAINKTGQGAASNTVLAVL
jgi:hypothetical protein